MGQRWYPASTPIVAQVGEGDILLGARLLAATSPRCALIDNLRRALRRQSPLPTHQANIARALRGEELSGPKVSAFARALSGDLDAITIDVWLCRALNIHPKLTTRQYLSAERRIRRAASRAHCNPRDFAASVWCGTLLIHNKPALNYADAMEALSQ